MILFVVLYVWQNIEVMKMKMEYRRELRAERQLADQNDRLRCEIEKYRRMELIERYAASKGMREITPADFEVIDIRKAK
jgi:hypothetical protein